MARLLERGESALAAVDGAPVFVHALARRPALYIFGAIDHASALARVGKLLGFRGTVCDARARFVTPERFPDADELVVEWPDRFLTGVEVDATKAICVLTHDEKFDVPVLVAALQDRGRLHRRDGQGDDGRPRGAPAGGGVDDAGIARIHAPIGLAIGARSPEEVAVAIGAEIVQATAAPAARGRRHERRRLACSRA